MKKEVRRVGRAIRDYAEAHGWSPGDYEMRGYISFDWGWFRVVLAARSFNDRPTLQIMNDVETHLDRSLGPILGLSHGVEIFPNGYCGPETVLPNLMGESDIDVTEELNEGRWAGSAVDAGRVAGTRES